MAKWNGKTISHIPMNERDSQSEKSKINHDCHFSRGCLPKKGYDAETYPMESSTFLLRNFHEICLLLPRNIPFKLRQKPLFPIIHQRFPIKIPVSKLLTFKKSLSYHFFNFLIIVLLLKRQILMRLILIFPDRKSVV